jgi:O-antigen/teichoic acid export membrane protein
MVNSGSVGKGALYLYIEAINLVFSSYVFWLILTKLTEPSVIGLSSTVVSMVTIFMVISSVGVTGGIQKYLGKSLASNNIAFVKGYINTSLLITLFGIIGSTIAILILGNWMQIVFKIDYSLLVIMILIMGFSSISGILRAVIIPSLKINVIAVTSILATAIKILIAVILVLVGTGVFGVLIGYLAYPVISTIIFVIVIRNTVYKQLFSKKLRNIFSSTREIFVVSLSFWIPSIINVVGSELGTVAVFVSSGSINAGVYFISYSIVAGTTLVVSVLSTIAYPMVGSMLDGRKNAVWRLIKISLIITVPLSAAIIFYSSEVLQIFGHEYTSGSENLIILLLSVIPTSILMGVGVLAYAYGHNNQFMLIGLFTSIPRLILYFILVPLFGGNGAALTYLIGSVAGFLLSLFIANRMNLKIFWNQIVWILVIPVPLAALFKISNLDFIIGIGVTLFISYVLFLKLRVLNNEDIKDVLNILPPKLAHLIVRVVKVIYSKSNKP